MDPQESSFRVIWSDVSYKVRPHSNFMKACDDIDRTTRRCITPLIKFYQRRSYDIEQKGLKKEYVTILRNVSGSIRSGELTAVMGPSGAGKTTLLNLIARRVDRGYSGRLHVEGSDRRLRISAIPQNDHLPSYLTVRENLLIASKLRNLSKCFNHERVIDHMAGLLNLERCLNLRTNEISGGQKKRVSIAQELMSKPDILILDEPTSGLDSLTCSKILAVMKSIVKTAYGKPIAILISIHQPEHSAFDIFDKVYALAPGGLAIYNGPPRDCWSYIKKHTGLEIPHDSYNPASFLIEIASGEHGQQFRDTLWRQTCEDHADLQCLMAHRNEPDSLDAKFHNKLYSPRQFINAIETNQKLYDDLKVDKRLAIGSSIVSSHFWTETIILSGRYYKSQVRDPLQLLFCLVAHILFPIGYFLFGEESSGKINGCPRPITQVSLRELAISDDMTNENIYHELEISIENLAIFFSATFAIFCFNSGLAALSFTLDMLSSLKEYHNGWYSISSYLTARILVDLPASIMMSTIFMTLLFYLIGQDAGGSLTLMERIILASMSTTLGAITGKLIGMICGALFMGQIITSIFVAQAALMPQVLFCGFMVRWKNMNPISKFIVQFSYLKHNLELNILARFGFKVCPCEPDALRELNISGISNDFRRFTNYYFEQISEENSTVLITNGTEDTFVGEDIFQLIGEQVALFNTYGRKIGSCDQMIPQALYELSSSDDHLTPTFVKYTLLVLSTVFVLFLVVKLVVRSKISI